MTRLKKCTFLHVAKCGGTFVDYFLEKYFIDERLNFIDHCFFLDELARDKLENRKIFVFVRSPLTFYSSFLSHFFYGTKTYYAHMCDPAIVSIGYKTDSNEIIKKLVNPTQEDKEKAVAKCIEMNGGLYGEHDLNLKILMNWLESDNTSYYQNLINLYVNNGYVTSVGKLENLNNDFKKMLFTAGYDANRINLVNTFEKKNVKIKNRIIINNEIKNLIKDVDKSIFKQFNYGDT